MPAPETHTPDSELGRFSQLILPCTLVHYSEEGTASSIRQEYQSARLVAEGRTYVRFQEHMLDLIHPQGEFARTITEGHYSRIAKMAGKVAVESMAFLGELRRGSHVSLGDTFGLQALTSALVTVNRPHESRVAHSIDRSAYFLAQYTGALAMAAPTQLWDSGNYTDTLAELAPAIQAMSSGIGESPEWCERKLFMLGDRLESRDRLTQIIDAEPAVETDDLKQARKHNDALLKELKRLRCYSVKSAVHAVGDTEWSIHDNFDLSAMQMATATHEIFFDQWPPQFMMLAIESYGSTSRLIVPEITTENDQPQNYEALGRVVFMDTEGRLYADMHGAIPYLTLYERAGKPQNYEALRQYLLQKLFDLTVPVQIVQEVTEGTKRMLRSEGVAPDDAPHLIADLLLPRVQRLKRFKTLGEFERTAAAMEASEDATVATSSRRRHPVVDHPRDLPPGYKASPEALALAAKLGITLEPNQTLVRRHNRGDETKGTVTHKAKDRKRE